MLRNTVREVSETLTREQNLGEGIQDWDPQDLTPILSYTVDLHNHLLDIFT